MSRTVLITGASRGIGRDIALLFGKEGYNVIINFLNSVTSAEALLQEILDLGGSAIIIKADVSIPSDVSKMVKKAFEKYGCIDVLINNAGVAHYSLLTDTSENDWNNLFNINVGGVFNCCKAISPYMIDNKYGKIINISSIWGVTGGACEVAYSSSKAAVIGFTKALAKELGPSNINVNCIAPGLISTGMNSALSDNDIIEFVAYTPLSRVGTGIDIAHTASFLASDKSSFITGQCINVDGGYVI